MQENSWPENDSSKKFDMSNSDSSETVFPVYDDNSAYLLTDGGYRRLKSAVVLIFVWAIVFALHWSSTNQWFIWGLLAVLGLQAIRVLTAKPQSLPPPIPREEKNYPFVSLLAAAKNEETVIANLVHSLCAQDYPSDRYEVWIVDDASSDRTPEVLAQLQAQFPQLHVLRREPNAGGGKSGALNQVLALTKGEFVAVFDADATVSSDLLRCTLPLFNDQKVGSVQVRKAIANHNYNFWTQGQAAEMALDAYFQQQRTAITGIGELRGNGQFMRRSALERCGGWNEQTITDDLDLTIRLHLDQWDIKLLLNPAVNEEGVTNFISLWHQRSRWAEGGYQRYLDYWQLILSNRMGTLKTIDLIGFLIIQYILPTAVIPDVIFAIAFRHLPVLTPLSTFGLFLALWAMFTGLIRTEKPSILTTIVQTIRGNIYLLHWFVVMGFTTTRMAFLPKRLKWVKTVHQGSH
jgi:1,2-diacylglycerol 3-beta-glucosyltransferase